MPGWTKNRYDENSDYDPNSASSQRPYRFEPPDQKRDVIATEHGYVKRQTYTDVHGNSRVKDEILVPINDAGTGLSTILGNAVVLDAYASRPSGGGAEINVVFSEPIRVANSAATWSVTLTTAYRASGTGAATARNFVLSNSSTHGRVLGANNEIRLESSGTEPAGATIQLNNNLTFTMSSVLAIDTGNAANTAVSTAVRSAFGTFTV